MNDRKLYLGVDLGGTNIAVGISDAGGNLSGKLSRPTPRGTGSIISAIAGACEQSLADAGLSVSDIDSLGVGVPGTIYPEGVVSYACNLGMKNVQLAKLLSERMGLPVFVENDGNCAAVGEYLVGCGRDAKSLLCVTIGTGVGGGFVENGRLFRGANGCGVELGHMVIEYGGRLCACSRRGCFETYASATALIRDCCEYIDSAPNSQCAAIAAERGGVDGRTIFLAMDAGDSGAGRVFGRYASYLACGLTNLVNIFQPELICIGGGISAQGERLLAPVRAILAEEDYARDCDVRAELVCARLGNDAGIIGAALLSRLKGEEIQ